MEDIIDSILKYCNSVEDDWDGYGGYPPTCKVKNNLKYLLSTLPNYILNFLDLYDSIVISPNGTVGLEWLNNNNKVWVDVGEDSMTVMIRQEVNSENIYDGKNDCLIQYPGILETYLHQLYNINTTI